MKKQKIIPNVGNVGVSPNEYMSRFSLNRNFELLVQNDSELHSSASAQVGTQVVRSFSENDTYECGELVWFKDQYGRFWLLRKIVNFTGKTDNPNDAVTTSSKKPDFEQHGWKNENEYIDVEEYGVGEKAARYVKSGINDHESDEQMHPYGELGRESDMEEKMLFSDVSNADSSRSSVFFPYRTVRLDAGDVILNGYARIWDCGLLEYDITYRMGYCGRDSDGYEILTCNNVEFSVTSNRDNQKYFNSVADMSIFAYENQSDKNYSRVEDTIQRNRNDYVNAYFAKIQFPQLTAVFGGKQKSVRFEDSRYMIFASNVMSQDRNFEENCVNPSPNQITYCDRRFSGFTSILVTFPDQNHFSASDEGYNATHGGLVSNTFHCTVIGKYTTD